MNLCGGCDNVAEQANHEGSHTPTWNWRCLRFPDARGSKYLTQERWPADGAPYLKCKYIRERLYEGEENCPDFTPLRNGSKGADNA